MLERRISSKTMTCIIAPSWIITINYPVSNNPRVCVISLDIEERKRRKTKRGERTICTELVFFFFRSFSRSIDLFNHFLRYTDASPPPLPPSPLFILAYKSLSDRLDEMYLPLYE